MLSYLFGGKTTDKKENDNAELAMREALDEHQEFRIEEDGTMNFEDYIVLRAVINRQQLRHVQAAKDKNAEKSLEIYKKSSISNEYAQNFGELQKIQSDAGKMITEKACEWIDFELKNFMASAKKISEDKEKTKTMFEKMTEVRKQYYSEVHKYDGTKEELLKAIMFKIEKEGEMHRKIMLQKYISPPQVVQSYTALESTKINDAMIVKFGFGMDKLMAGVETFKLQQDPKFKSLNEMSIKQRQNDEQKFINSCTPSEETKQAYLKEGRTFGKPQFKADQTLTFDYFLDTKMKSLDYSTKHTEKEFEAMKELRRKDLKALQGTEENKEVYYLQLIKKVAMQTITERVYDGLVYQDLKVPEKVYQKSMGVYLMDPEKRKIYEDETEKIREKYCSHKAVAMTPEQVIDAQKRLEQFKFDAQQKMYAIVKSQQMPPEMINTVILFEKDRADDQFWVETGFEEEDVEKAIISLKLEDDPQLKKIKEEWEAKSTAYLQERAQEAMKQQANAQARQQQMQKLKQQNEAVEQQASQLTPAAATDFSDNNMAAILM